MGSLYKGNRKTVGGMQPRATNDEDRRRGIERGFEVDKDKVKEALKIATGGRGGVNTGEPQDESTNFFSRSFNGVNYG